MLQQVSKVTFPGYTAKPPHAENVIILVSEELLKNLELLIGLSSQS